MLRMYNKSNSLNKVLFLLHLPPPVHGSSIVGDMLSKSKLINSRFSCEFINILASESIQKTGKFQFKKLIGFIGIWLKLLFSLIFNRPSLCCHALTTSGLAFSRDFFLVLTVKLFRVPIVYHMHNKGVSNNQNKLLYNFGYMFIFNKAKVILLSKLLHNDISKYVPFSEVYICPYGIVEHEVNSNLVKSHHPNILFLSNLIESKGVVVLLEACKILMNKNIDFYCNFIGSEGDIDRNKFDLIVSRLGIKSKVSYLGRKVGEEKNNYLKRADIFVFPTYYHFETFGLVNLEAMQYGLPVISTNEGGIPDIVENGKTGFLVRKNDPEHLADMLEILVQDKDLRLKMGEAGKVKFHKEYTIDVFENRLSEILSDILDKKNSPYPNSFITL